MIPRTMVIPYDADLLFRLGAEQSVVISINDLEDVREVVDTADRAGSRIHCLKVDTGVPLSILDFPDGIDDIPIALHVSGMGRFPDLAGKLGRLRELDVRIFMPARPRENLTASRIFSSLGFENVLTLNGGGIDWEELADLMTYALFIRVPHAPIAPFNYAAEIYKPDTTTDFSAIYFDDPNRFLHLDVEGRVAMTSADLEEGVYLAERIEDLEDLDTNEKYLGRLQERWDFFPQAEGCAYCPGWRLCLGKFHKTREAEPGCSKFFSDFMDVLDEYQGSEKGEEKRWQL